MAVPDSPPDLHPQTGNQQNSMSNPQKLNKKSATVGGTALAVLVAVYAFAQPVLNEKLGWHLPGIERLAGNDTVAKVENSDRKSESKPSPVVQEPASDATKVSDTKPPAAGPLANVRPKAGANTSAETVDNTTEDQSLLFGILSDQGNDRFLSPAGLMYVPGSQEGHRLKHVERHTVDDPARPGSHGVFDGGMEGALATIDKAYRKAKNGTQTSKQEEDGRTIYTVDMGSRVGFIGGSDGRRRKNPMARRVRLVLERNRVITAYPM